MGGDHQEDRRAGHHRRPTKLVAKGEQNGERGGGRRRQPDEGRQVQGPFGQQAIYGSACRDDHTKQDNEDDGRNGDGQCVETSPLAGAGDRGELLLLRLGRDTARVILLAVLVKLREEVPDGYAAVNLAEGSEGFHAGLVRRLPIVSLWLRTECGEKRVRSSLRVLRSGAGTHNIAKGIAITGGFPGGCRGAATA